MAEWILIKRLSGDLTMVRTKLETASEDPLTEHEQIINELNKERLYVETLLLSIDELLPEDNFVRLSNSYNKLKEIYK